LTSTENGAEVTCLCPSILLILATNSGFAVNYAVAFSVTLQIDNQWNFTEYFTHAQAVCTRLFFVCPHTWAKEWG